MCVEERAEEKSETESHANDKTKRKQHQKMRTPAEAIYSQSESVCALLVARFFLLLCAFSADSAFGEMFMTRHMCCTQTHLWWEHIYINLLAAAAAIAIFCLPVCTHCTFGCVTPATALSCHSRSHNTSHFVLPASTSAMPSPPMAPASDDACCCCCCCCCSCWLLLSRSAISPSSSGRGSSRRL